MYIVEEENVYDVAELLNVHPRLARYLLTIADGDRRLLINAQEESVDVEHLISIVINERLRSLELAYRVAIEKCFAVIDKLGDTLSDQIEALNGRITYVEQVR